MISEHKPGQEVTQGKHFKPYVADFLSVFASFHQQNIKSGKMILDGQ